MQNSTGKLYVIATPIGNLQDITFRAVETLKSCDLIACEDTRTSSILLNFYNIKKPLIAYHDKNETSQANFIAEQIISGKNIGLVSDAGTPTISDPGFRIVRLCRKKNLDVIPIPGASAAIAALSISGLPTDSFIFIGFPGHKNSSRLNILNKYKDIPATLIFYESCYRIMKFLTNIYDIYGPNRIVNISKEITKHHEQYCTGTIGAILEWIKTVTIKGEFVITIAPENFVL